MAKKPLRVGFDLDGVILYNPIRTLRPLSSVLSKLIFRKKKTSFYYPKSKFEQFLWYVIHKSSFMIAPGFHELEKLVKDNKVEAYLITGRYASLRHDFEAWMKRVNADKVFTSYIHNEQNQQPHLFKKAMIVKHDLDVFVEDNWDIVRQLKHKGTAANKGRKDFKILWITNLLDRHKNHDYKFSNLRSTIDYLKKITSN